MKRGTRGRKSGEAQRLIGRLRSRCCRSPTHPPYHPSTVPTDLRRVKRIRCDDGDPTTAFPEWGAVLHTGYQHFGFLPFSLLII